VWRWPLAVVKVFGKEVDMELKTFFQEQLEREAAASRKAIERVPEGQNGWKPREKSIADGALSHLAPPLRPAYGVSAAE
jgi:hypothetical protein